MNNIVLVESYSTWTNKETTRTNKRDITVGSKLATNLYLMKINAVFNSALIHCSGSWRTLALLFPIICTVPILFIIVFTIMPQFHVVYFCMRDPRRFWFKGTVEWGQQQPTWHKRGHTHTACDILLTLISYKSIW